MQYYVVLRGDTLEFQKTKPDCPSVYCVTAFEDWQLSHTRRCFPWQKFNDRVKKVRFLDPISPVSTEKWFFLFDKLVSFDKTNLDLSEATTLEKMFDSCYGLQTLDLSGLDTSKVTNMEGVFCYCTHLSSVHLTGWDTSNVRNFKKMFDLCSSLLHLDIGSFSMESAHDISYLLSQCCALRSLTEPKQPAKQRLIAKGTFSGCNSLKHINLSAFGEFSEATNIFMECGSLENIRTSSIDCLQWLTQND